MFKSIFSLSIASDQSLEIFQTKQLQDVETSAAKISEQIILLELLFNINRDTYEQWPGLKTYVEYLENQIATQDLSCFEPVWKLVGFQIPISMGDMHIFLRNLVVSMGRKREQLEGLTLDDLLQRFVHPYGAGFDLLDESGIECSRQAVFIAVSWLSMFYSVPHERSPGLLRINVPEGRNNILHEIDSGHADEPVGRVVGQFGSLIPSKDDVVTYINEHHGGLLYATSLNIATLKSIDKIQIEWTDVLSFHLEFNPLKRKLLLYRFPTLCAMNADDTKINPLMTKSV